MIEFKKRGLKANHQIDIPIFYDGQEVGLHRLDLLVDDTIVVELKAIKNIEEIHFAIVRSYLKATGKQHGLILNFAKVTLEARRVLNPG